MSRFEKPGQVAALVLAAGALGWGARDLAEYALGDSPNRAAVSRDSGHSLGPNESSNLGFLPPASLPSASFPDLNANIRQVVGVSFDQFEDLRLENENLETEVGELRGDLERSENLVAELKVELDTEKKTRRDKYAELTEMENMLDDYLNQIKGQDTFRWEEHNFTRKSAPESVRVFERGGEVFVEFLDPANSRKAEIAIQPYFDEWDQDRGGVVTKNDPGFPYRVLALWQLSNGN